MSAYCLQADIEGEISAPDLIALTDDQSTGSLDTTVLNQIIANASGEIDGKVSNIYSTPFSPIPTAVKSMAITIACYRLLRRRLTPDEKNLFYQDYKDAQDFLNKVNIGEAHIDLTQERDFTQVAMTGRSSIYGAFGTSALSNSM